MAVIISEKDTHCPMQKIQKNQLFIHCTSGLILALISGIFFFLSYRINQLTDSWAIYSTGISLIFLPAGIKQIAILVGKGWGALGCGMTLYLMAAEYWVGVPPHKVLGYALTSIAGTWIGITLSLRLLGIGSDLARLKFIHLPLMDLITVTTHGLLANAYLVGTGMKTSALVSNALAMMVGDFTGSFIVMMLLLGGMRLKAYLNAPRSSLRQP